MRLLAEMTGHFLPPLRHRFSFRLLPNAVVKGPPGYYAAGDSAIHILQGNQQKAKTTHISQQVDARGGGDNAALSHRLVFYRSHLQFAFS